MRKEVESKVILSSDYYRAKSIDTCYDGTCSHGLFKRENLRTTSTGTLGFIDPCSHEQTSNVTKKSCR